MYLGKESRGMTRVSEIFSCHTDTVVTKVQNAFDHDSYKLVSEILSRFLVSGTGELEP